MDKDEKKDTPRDTDTKSQHRRRSDRSKRQQRNANAETFRGDHEDLSGHVYTYDSAARTNQYEKTSEKIAQWTKREMSFPMDIWRAVIGLEEPDTDD